MLLLPAMNAREFIDEFGADEAERVAIAAGTNMAYFRQIANGHRNAGFGLAQRLVGASDERLDLLALLGATDDRKQEGNAAG